MKLRQSTAGRRLGVALWVALWVASLAGCAGGSARTRQLVGNRTLPRPPFVAVYDFSVNAEDVVVDTFGPSFGGGSKPESERQQRARQASRVFSERLVAKLNERGIPARRATPDTSVPLHALVVKGQFVKINEGDQVRRMVIGFGSGARQVQARAQVYQVTEMGLQRVSESEGEAEGDKFPGMAGPGAVAGAAGTVVPVVVSGGMNLGKETMGGLDQQLDDLAEEAAKRAAEFYSRQGWL